MPFIIIPTKKEKVSKFFRGLILTLGSVGLCVIGVSILIYSLSLKLPDVESMSMYIPAETTKIYSMDNVLLAELHKEENRIQIPLEKISHELRKTLIAVEDTDFMCTMD